MNTIARLILLLLLIFQLSPRTCAKEPPVEQSAPTKPQARFEVVRFKENPIIRPGMEGLEGPLGENINGPTLMRVPAWVEKPLGKYYLYFAHHAGKYIRLATADHLEGPWTIYKSGVLGLADAPGIGHIASPEIYVDDAAKEIRLYFHQPPPRDSAAKEQQTFVALSKDGLHFTARHEMLGHAYMRVFAYKGAFYGYGMSGIADGVLMRSKDGLTPFEDGPHSLNKVRHSACWRADDTLYFLHTTVGDTPERIYLSTIDLTKDWKDWKPTLLQTLLEPEKDYEGADLPLRPSQNGISLERVRQLRDPAIFEDFGKRYLLYTVAGEKGIAIGEIVAREK